MNIFEEYELAKKKQKEAKDEMTDLECKMYELFQNDLSADEGTFNFEQDGYSLKVVKKMTVSVDQEMAATCVGGFTTRHTFSKTQYAKLDNVGKAAVDECLTAKPAKPSFKVEKL